MLKLNGTKVKNILIKKKKKQIARQVGHRHKGETLKRSYNTRKCWRNKKSEKKRRKEVIFSLTEHGKCSALIL